MSDAQTTPGPTVGIVMGSQSDLPHLEPAIEVLSELGVSFEVDVVSAHRTPERMFAYGQTADARGLQVIIAAAGGAAHLPGMLASLTVLPVVGVPVPLKHLDGLDSLLSIVQMPGGVPVATVAVGNGKNAGVLAAQIAAVGDPALRERLRSYKAGLKEKVAKMSAAVRREG
jgi:5-(carboxyamino)imidazole ribonucleotide mutase